MTPIDFSKFGLNAEWTVTDLSGKIPDTILDAIVSEDDPNKWMVITSDGIYWIEDISVTRVQDNA